MNRGVTLLSVLVCLLVGCMHSPPAGAERGVVQVLNLQMREGTPGFLNVGVLTGVAVDEHVILTAAHAFLYEPEDGHPIKIDREPVVYEILADGWGGHRHKMDPMSKNVPDMSMISHDYLLLRTHKAFPDHATLVPLEFDRLSEVRRSTLVTRERGTPDPVAIPIDEVTVSRGGEWMMIELKNSRSIDVERLRVSGSPLIGAYRDGTLVLLGIASASGTAFMGSDTHREIRENQVFFTPAYRMPWDALTEK
ncbi:MAG: hypothetical protein NXI07_05090 [bacterium]|nr:hypothetical protein [bacterium]